MIEPPRQGQPSFIDALRCANLAALAADLAIIGVPYGITGATAMLSTARAGSISDRTERLAG